MTIEGKAARLPKRPRAAGSACIWPRGVELRLGVSPITRWRMERDGRLPPRDFFIGGKAVGWRVETMAAAESGKVAA